MAFTDWFTRDFWSEYAELPAGESLQAQQGFASPSPTQPLVATSTEMRLAPNREPVRAEARLRAIHELGFNAQQAMSSDMHGHSVVMWRDAVAGRDRLELRFTVSPIHFDDWCRGREVPAYITSCTYSPNHDQQHLMAVAGIRDESEGPREPARIDPRGLSGMSMSTFNPNPDFSRVGREFDYLAVQQAHRVQEAIAHTAQRFIGQHNDESTQRALQAAMQSTLNYIADEVRIDVNIQPARPLDYIGMTIAASPPPPTPTIILPHGSEHLMELRNNRGELVAYIDQDGNYMKVGAGAPETLSAAPTDEAPRFEPGRVIDLDE
jgi:hypothetical protein